MKILHVLDHSIPLQSGYTFRTLAILREQRALGWETFHLTSPKHTAPGAPEEEVDGLRFFRTQWRPTGAANLPAINEVSLMRALARRLNEVVSRLSPDVIHVHSPVLNALPSLWVGKKHGIPVLYEVRAFWEDAAVDHGTSVEWGPRYRLTRALETYALRRASHVTTICEGLRTEIVARGVPASKVTVIRNAVDVEAFPVCSEPDSTLKQNLGLKNATVVGFIGSFYAYEGLDLLVEAMPLILPTVPDLRLLLVGGGPQEAALKELVAQRGLNDKVVFAGRVPHGDVQRYYSVIDVLAYPRRSMRLTELVTPLKPLEAMAQGKLLIASNVGGHRELIRDGETGILFEAGDAGKLAGTLSELLRQPNRWPEIRTRARRFVETERNWRDSVARYKHAYAVVSSRQGAA